MSLDAWSRSSKDLLHLEGRRDRFDEHDGANGAHRGMHGRPFLRRLPGGSGRRLRMRADVALGPLDGCDQSAEESANAGATTKIGLQDLRDRMLHSAWRKEQACIRSGHGRWSVWQGPAEATLKTTPAEGCSRSSAPLRSSR